MTSGNNIPLSFFEHNATYERAYAQAVAYQDVARIEDEGWMKDHQRAMECRDMEDTLKRGMKWFELFVKIDEVLRPLALRDKDVARGTAAIKIIRDLFQWWLGPCERVEKEILQLEHDKFPPDGREQFRAAYARTAWAYATGDKAFASAAFSALTDRATEEHTQGKSTAIERLSD